MRKAGVYTTGDGLRMYYVYYYEDKQGTRIDVTLDNKTYHDQSTDNCASSVIVTDKTVFFGDKNIVDSIRKIISKASTYPIPDNTNIQYINGALRVSVLKESEDKQIYFCQESTNGALSREVYKTEEGTMDFSVYEPYAKFDIKPMNYIAYEEAFTEEQVTQVKPTEEGYYDFKTLWNMYPQARHVLTDKKNVYCVITSYEEAQAKLKEWIDAPTRYKCIDIESYDKEWYPGSSNRITGVILGYDEHWGTYFPFRQERFKYNLPLEFLRQIFDAVNNQPKDVWIFSHNGKFEIEGFLQEFRELLRIDIDTMILSKLVFPSKYDDHSLKGLMDKLFGVFYLELKNIFKGKIRFNILPEDIVGWYACPDVTNPIKLFKKLMKMLPEDERALFFDVETRLLKVKAYNEFYGLKLDEEQLADYLPKLEADVEKLKNIFMQMHGTTRNINSSDTIMDIMYNKLKIKPTVFTDKKMPATSKTAIKEAIAAGYKLGPLNPDAPIPEDIVDHTGEVLVKGQDMRDNRYPSLLVYQQYKLLDKKLIDQKRLVANCFEGFFHFYVNQLGADSSRQTSDAQQFSKTMKKMAIADTDQHHLCSCDYHQVELRLLFGLAGEKELYDLACIPGNDLHRSVASILRRKPIYMISEEERQNSKGINFGIVYMMSEYGMAARDCGVRYTEEDLIERRNRINEFMNAFPNIKAFLEANKKIIRNTGKISTAFGYYRYFPQVLVPDATEKTIKAAVRSGNNTPVQGLCATILKMSEILIFEEFEKRGWLKEKDYGNGLMRPMARLVLPIHDEHLFVFDKSIPIEEICDIFKRCMEFPIDGIPPLFSSPAIVKNWLQAKNPAYEIDLGLRDKCIEDYKKGIITFGDRPYLEVLKEYNDREVSAYLNPLIAQYKTPEEVAKHVKHDSITHTIIADYVPDKVRYSYTHEERIVEGVRGYMAGHKNDIEDFVVADAEDDDWGSVYEHEDDEGNLIVEQVGDVEDSYILEELEAEKEAIIEKEFKRFIYTLTDLFIDLTGLSNDVALQVDELMKEVSKPNGDYNVVYIVGKQHVRTNLFVPYDATYARALQLKGVG